MTQGKGSYPFPWYLQMQSCVQEEGEEAVIGAAPVRRWYELVPGDVPTHREAQRRAAPL